MEKTIWDENCSIGVQKFDEQHKQIIEMISTLIEKKNEEVASETIWDILKKMAEYADNHFRDEELYMKEVNYPEYSEHMKLHNEFSRETSHFCKVTMENKMPIKEELEEMVEYLKKWWTNHITAEDKKYVSL